MLLIRIARGNAHIGNKIYSVHIRCCTGSHVRMQILYYSYPGDILNCKHLQYNYMHKGYIFPGLPSVQIFFHAHKLDVKWLLTLKNSQLVSSPIFMELEETYNEWYRK